MMAVAAKLISLSIMAALFFVMMNPNISLSKFRSCKEPEKLFNQNSSLGVALGAGKGFCDALSQ